MRQNNYFEMTYKNIRNFTPGADVGNEDSNCHSL